MEKIPPFVTTIGPIQIAGQLDLALKSTRPIPPVYNYLRVFSTVTEKQVLLGEVVEIAFPPLIVSY